MSFVARMAARNSELDRKRCSACDASYTLAPLLVWFMFLSLAVRAKSKNYVAGLHVKSFLTVQSTSKDATEAAP